MRRDSAAYAILAGGAIAGALDIIYAITFSYAVRGTPPERLLQFIASGLLGASAFEGGTSAAALGLVLHFLIMFVIAAVFYVASRHLPVLTQRPVVAGIVYGIVVFAVMNFIVLPLSALPQKVTFSPLGTSTNLLSHMFFIGVPIALAARKSLKAAPAA